MSRQVSLQESAFLQNSNDYFLRACESAAVVLPHVFRLVGPSSVADFGCGGGAWLKVCRELGVQDILGIDGNYVDSQKLGFPREYFFPHDLRDPIAATRRFDLVISLEVAEHIPLSSCGTFLDSLIRLAPVVLFSAAVPYQGGVGHVNEQWPSYWCDLFEQRGYLPVDCIRRLVWTDKRVDLWYRQNTLLFVSSDYLETSDALRSAYDASKGLPLDVVHPNRYLQEADPRQIDARKVPLETALKAVRLQLRRRLRKSLHWRLKKFVKLS